MFLEQTVLFKLNVNSYLRVLYLLSSKVPKTLIFVNKKKIEINADECKKCHFLHFILSPLINAKVFYTDNHIEWRTTKFLHLMQISSQYICVFILNNIKIIYKLNQILDFKRAYFNHCSLSCLFYAWVISMVCAAQMHACHPTYYAGRLRVHDTAGSKMSAKQCWLIIGGFIPRQNCLYCWNSWIKIWKWKSRNFRIVNFNNGIGRKHIMVLRYYKTSISSNEL